MNIFLRRAFLPSTLAATFVASTGFAGADEPIPVELRPARPVFGAFTEGPKLASGVAPAPVPSPVVNVGDDPSAMGTIDAKKTRDAILAGIRTLPPLTGAVSVVPYGAGAVSVVDQWARATPAGSALVAAAWGKGRVVAVAGHRCIQLLGTTGTEVFDPLFLNCAAFAAGTDAKDIRVVVCEPDAQARNTEIAWLKKQGYTNLVGFDPMNAKTASSAPALFKDAKLLVGRCSRSLPESARAISDFAMAGGGLFIGESTGAPLFGVPGIGFVAAKGVTQARRATGGPVRVSLEKLLTGGTLTPQEMLMAGDMMIDLPGILPTDNPLAARCTRAILERAARVFPDADQVFAPAPFDLLCLGKEGEMLLKLSADEIVRRGPHRMADGFGRIAADAKPVLKSLVMRDRSECCTGLYAMPGRGVRVTVPKEWVGKVSFMVGSHAWPFLGAFVGQDIHAMPHCRFTFPCEAESTLVASPFGGLVYVFPAKGVEWKDLPVTVDGAIESPSFILGKTTPQEWSRLKNAPAPWGEVAATHFNTVQSAFYLRRLADPTPGIAMWDEGMRMDQACLQSPTIAARYQSDLFPKGGAAWMPQGTAPGRAWTLLDPRWGISDYFLHEFGHTIQSGYNTPPGAGEASNNWAGFTVMGISARSMGANAVNAMNAVAKGGNYFPGSSHGNSTPWSNVISGYVFNFGWDAFWKPPAALKAIPPAEIKASGFGGYDLWLREWSKACGRDVRPYFTRFGITATPVMNAEIDALRLPKWDFVYHPAFTSVTTRGRPVRLPSPLANAFSADGKVTFAWAGKPAHGTLATESDGGATYKPEAGFTGLDEIPFTLTNGLGYTDSFTMSVRVTAVDAPAPAFTMGRVDKVGLGAWTPVRFSHAYKTPVILTTPWEPGSHEPENAWSRPLTVRVRNLTGEGCEMKLHRLDGLTEEVAQDVSFLVMEEGVYTQPKSGVWIEARRKEMTLSNARTGLRDKPVTPWSIAPAKSGFGTPWTQVQSTRTDIPAYARTPWMPKMRTPLGGAIMLIHAPGPDAPTTPETLGYATFGAGAYRFGDKDFLFTTARIACDGECVINPEHDGVVKYREIITKSGGFSKYPLPAGFLPQPPPANQVGLIDTWYLFEDRGSPEAFKDITMNVSGKLSGAGEYAVQFLCGNCEPADIRSVVLLKDGVEVARDGHADTFGLGDKLPARYALKLSAHDPKAVYKLRVNLRLRFHTPENDADRSASVYLFKVAR
jgi:hypothetical protein